MQHGVAPTLTDTPVAFTLKDIVALTLKMVLYLPWNSSTKKRGRNINLNLFSKHYLYAVVSTISINQIHLV